MLLNRIFKKVIEYSGYELNGWNSSKFKEKQEKSHKTAKEKIKVCMDIPSLGNRAAGDLETSGPVHRKRRLSIILEIQQGAMLLW